MERDANVNILSGKHQSFHIIKHAGTVREKETEMNIRKINMGHDNLYQFDYKILHINCFFFACMSLKNSTVAMAILIFFA